MAVPAGVSPMAEPVFSNSSSTTLADGHKIAQVLAIHQFCVWVCLYARFLSSWYTYLTLVDFSENLLYFCYSVLTMYDPTWLPDEIILLADCKAK